jgi:hypothetical protein
MVHGSIITHHIAVLTRRLKAKEGKVRRRGERKRKEKKKKKQFITHFLMTETYSKHGELVSHQPSWLRAVLLLLSILDLYLQQPTAKTICKLVNNSFLFCRLHFRYLDSKYLPTDETMYDGSSLLHKIISEVKKIPFVPFCAILEIVLS